MCQKFLGNHDGLVAEGDGGGHAQKGAGEGPPERAQLHGCHGDDFWGMSRAVLSVGWCLRNLHGTRIRRPARPEGPAAPAAGWRLHRGKPKSGNEDKIPSTVVSPKVAWPRHDRQRQRTVVTHVTTRLHQPESKSLPHERIRGKREGICLPDAGPRGKRRFIKCDRQSRARGSRRRHSHGGADNRPAGHVTCNQTPAYIRGSGPLD
jgi:hypothetical protein